MPLEIDPALIDAEFDEVVAGPITADELVAFARALGETRPEYTAAGQGLIGHPTYCLRFRGRRFYPEALWGTFNPRTGLDAGKDFTLGVPVRPGDTIHIRCTLHEVYEKTGRTGTMTFVVIRFVMTNQRDETVAVIDNRFMHR